MLNALLVDDESPARKRLKKLLAPLEKDGRLQIVAEAADGVEALSILEEEEVDVIFLDVQMPELTGFDVLERLPEDVRPVVIFVTAYDAYAVRAFEANAVDYLLKPISAERLEKSVARAERVTGKPEERSVNEARFNKLLDWLEEQEGGVTPPRKTGEYLQQLSIPYRDKMLVVPVERIVAAEVRDGITRMIVLDDRPGVAPSLSEYIVSYTLDQLEQNLDPDDFMRVHRSTIVQLKRIKEMISWFSGRFKLILEGGHEVIASRERSKGLRARLTL